jgi:SAM-dependent methyltransferase
MLMDEPPAVGTVRTESISMGSTAMQGQLWGRAAHDWAELQEPLAAPLWEALRDAAGVGPGTRVLDAGCGAGGASVLAASRGARVNGLDAAVGLLAIARQRVPDGDFRVGDLEALPYADGVFDAVLVANVLPYVADPRVALCEVRRVCAPGGRVALATWGVPEDCDQWAVIAAVRETLRSMLLAPLGEESLALAKPGTLEALVGQAGLRVTGAGTVACLYQYPDPETAWQAQASAGPLQAALRATGTAQLKAAVLRAIAPYGISTGGVCLKNSFRYVTAAP